MIARCNLIQQNLIFLQKDLGFKFGEIKDSLQSVIHRAETLDEVSKYKLDVLCKSAVNDSNELLEGIKAKIAPNKMLDPKNIFEQNIAFRVSKIIPFDSGYLNAKKLLLVVNEGLPLEQQLFVFTTQD